MDHTQLLLLLTCLVGFIMTWGVGANDLANVMSTTMGSKAITVRQALLIAIIFEFAGAILGSGSVSNTIRSGIIDTNSLALAPQILIYGMLAVLLAGTVWMLVASYLGLPVSITNAIVGGLVGFGAIVLGLRAIHWPQVGLIALSWVCAPVIAGIISYALFRSVQRLILIRENPLSQARRILPFYFFGVGIVLAFMVILKGLHHFGISLNIWADILLVLASGAVVMLIGQWVNHRIDFEVIITSRDRFAAIENSFSVLMAFTTCAMVFAHGSNDVAIAVGPMAAIFTILRTGTLNGHIVLPSWIVLVW